MLIGFFFRVLKEGATKGLRRNALINTSPIYLWLQHLREKAEEAGAEMREVAGKIYRMGSFLWLQL